MDVQEQLRQSIEQQQIRLRQGVPDDRASAILALIRAIDEQANSIGATSLPDLITGRLLANPGGNKALMLCLDAPSASDIDSIRCRSG